MWNLARKQSAKTSRHLGRYLTFNQSCNACKLLIDWSDVMTCQSGFNLKINVTCTKWDFSVKSGLKTQIYCHSIQTVICDVFAYIALATSQQILMITDLIWWWYFYNTCKTHFRLNPDNWVTCLMSRWIQVIGEYKWIFVIIDQFQLCMLYLCLCCRALEGT